MAFKSPKEAEKAYRNGAVELHTRVKVRITDTTIHEDGTREKNACCVIPL